jgi:hypothetical protein
MTAGHDIGDTEHIPNVRGSSDLNTEAKTTSTTQSLRQERTLANQLLIAMQCPGASTFTSSRI